jgi:cytoskeleton protein RodZ
MTDTTRAVDTPPAAEPSSAGTRLREARTAAGLSIDAVAQQLKLAPRQVTALESDDFAALPGRTFVRGFVRNYARLLHLDTTTILAALPEGDAAPSLDRPALSTTTRTMGELPADLHAKSSSARWAIPLALVAIVGIAAVYEWSRPHPATTRASPETKAPTAVAPSTTLPPATPAPESAPASAPATPVPATAPFPVDNSKASVVDSGNATAAVAPANAPLVLVFRGSSWVEIKDSKGVVLLSTMGFPGATHAVDGTSPFDVIIGNAEAVTVTVRGEAFDVGPHIRQNVAKFTVK